MKLLRINPRALVHCVTTLGTEMLNFHCTFYEGFYIVSGFQKWPFTEKGSLSLSDLGQRFLFLRAVCSCDLPRSWFFPHLKAFILHYANYFANFWLQTVSDYQMLKQEQAHHNLWSTFGPLPVNLFLDRATLSCLLFIVCTCFHAK